MTPEDALKMRDAIREIDGGCENCIAKFLKDLTKVFPEINWNDIVWNKCSICGKVLNNAYWNECDEHRKTKEKLSKLSSEDVADAFLKSVDNIADIFTRDDGFYGKFKK